jgi:hypothetical protein
MKTTFIYYLECPITNMIRYIGHSDNPKQRFYSHIKESSLKRTHKECWIYGLICKNKKPILYILDEIPNSEWQFWEKHYISLYKSLGFNLVNSDEGGFGMSSEYMKNNNPMHRPEIVKKLTGSGNGNYGKKFSQEHVEKLGKAKKGKPSWRTGKKGECITEDMKIKFLYKPIKCIQNDRIYKSVIDAALDLQLSKEAISAVARGDRKHHKGFIFEYV